MRTSRAFRWLAAVSGLLGLVASTTIPSWFWSRAVSAACSAVVIWWATVEIRRSREVGPYSDQDTHVSPRE